MNENEMLTLLQAGIPLVHAPFKLLAKMVGAKEDEVINLLKRSFDNGMIRRFGAIFDAHSLGYVSTLAAVHLEGEHCEQCVEKLNAHDGVTHNYLRSGSPNIWFTLTAHKSEFDEEKRRIELMCSPAEVYWLPAIARYKIEVVFNLETGDVNHKQMVQTHPQILDLEDKRIIAYLQKPFPLIENPFEEIAHNIGIPESVLLEKLQTQQRCGALRRIAVILRHARSGIIANSMVMWRVNAHDADRLGKKIAEDFAVSHCYLRDVPPQIAGNLYAMMHAKTQAELTNKIENLTQSLNLPSPFIFQTLKELKKRSPIFFKNDQV